MSRGLRRRSVLLGLLALLGALVIGRLLRRPHRPGNAAPPADPAEAAARDLLPAGADPAILLAVADVVVPRSGDLPAASEIDLLPRLATWAHRDPRRLRFYREQWAGFERAVREQVPFSSGRPDGAALEARCRAWYDSYRENPRERTARFFEVLRQDVLRLYYSHPVGWASAGYRGPVRRAHPHQTEAP